MSNYQEKIVRHTKRETRTSQFDETTQESEPDEALMLKLSDWEFRTTIINMLRVLNDKVKNMQDWMGKQRG